MLTPIQKKSILTIISILTLTQIAKSDLPIHCIQAQIEGTWTLHLSEAQTVETSKDSRCGYSSPSSPDTAKDNLRSDKFDEAGQISVVLDQYNKVYGTGEHQSGGQWTMLYDEGFQVQFDGISYLAWFKYNSKNGVKISYCDETLIGFFTNSDGQHGCFYGVQDKKTNDLDSKSLGDRIQGAEYDSVHKKPSRFLTGREKKGAKKVKVEASLLAQTGESDDFGLDDDDEGSDEEEKPREHSKERKKKVGNIFHVMAKSLLSHKALKKQKEKISSILRSGHQMQRGKTMGVNNYLGYLPFFAQTSSQIIQKSQTSFSKATHVRAKSDKEFYFNLDPKAVKKLEGKDFQVELRTKKIGGKLRLIGHPYGKDVGDVGDFILAAQTGYKLLRKGDSDKDSQTEFSSEEFVKKVNEGGLKWKAANYDFLKGKTIKMINNRFKRKKRLGDTQDQKIIKEQRDMKSVSRIDKMLAQDRTEDKSRAKEEKPLPKSLDLFEYLTPSRNQGNCGSCYLVATISMLEARARYLYKKPKEFKLSIQQVLNCNYYAQGCEGGFSLEALRYIKEFGALPERCEEYKAEDQRCSVGCFQEIPKSEQKVTKVTDYYYVGGHYGACSEEAMMKEILKNGPVVANIEPTADFSFYKTGVFEPMTQTAWQGYGDKLKKEWFKVDHSILVYGWGETDDGVKYWRVMNSWGGNWGEQGAFKIVRGVNAIAIETSAEAGIPIIEDPNEDGDADDSQEDNDQDDSEQVKTKGL